MTNTNVVILAVNNTPCVPFRKGTFPSYNQTGVVVPFSCWMNVNEKVEMIVRCSWVYDRRNNVASTGTALEPTASTTADEYLLRTVMLPTMTQR